MVCLKSYLKKYGHATIENILILKTKLQQFYFTDPSNNKRKCTSYNRKQTSQKNRKEEKEKLMKPGDKWI